jgi:type I thyroxine 5'-deiodinase
VNKQENVIYEDPRHYGERMDLAGTCSINLGIKFPALVDSMENTTEAAYTAWPDRLYLIDRSGRIVYKSGAGPFGFNTEQLSKAIVELLEGEAKGAAD